MLCVNTGLKATINGDRYHDPEHTSFGSLRVINEDRVEPDQGFGPHPHSEFEIFSYLVHGQLEQRVWNICVFWFELIRGLTVVILWEILRS